jgi:hypothetical protein
MKKPPKGAIFETIEMTKVDFFQSSLNKLQDDVGTILKLLEEHNIQSARKVGFWASMRLIMPIIEAVAYVAGETPQEFLKNHLEVTAPYLTWDLFRHSLIHGDYMQHAKYQSKEVGWGIAFIGVDHVITSGHIGIDAIHLYNKLNEYLTAEVARNDQAVVKIEVGVLYQNPKQEIVDEFNKLCGKG